MPAPPLLPVVVNTSGGGAARAGESLAQTLKGAFAATGQAIDLRLVSGDRIDEAAAEGAKSPRVAVGGGDGTLAAGAAAAVQHGSELAVLPLGTRNHFARQLGVPLELGQAAALAASGGARLVDVGEANGRVFINNLSVGAYVELVRQRDASRLPKLLAMIPAAWRTLRRLRSRPFELVIDGSRTTVRTPLLFIGNNRYQVEEGRPDERTALDDGLLSVYAVAPLSPASLVAVVLRMLVGRPRMHSDFALDRTAREVRIESPGTALEVALDGERCRFDLPLTVRILPRALAVVAPPSD